MLRWLQVFILFMKIKSKLNNYSDAYVNRSNGKIDIM